MAGSRLCLLVMLELVRQWCSRTCGASVAAAAASACALPEPAGRRASAAPSFSAYTEHSLRSDCRRRRSSASRVCGAAPGASSAAASCRASTRGSARRNSSRSSAKRRKSRCSSAGARPRRSGSRARTVRSAAASLATSSTTMSWNCRLCSRARCSCACQWCARRQAVSQRALAAARRARTRSAAAAERACAATCDPTTFRDTTIDLCESRSRRNSRWSCEMEN